MNRTEPSEFQVRMNLLQRICAAYAHPLEVIFRDGFGSRYNRRTGWGIIALLLHFALIAGNQQKDYMGLPRENPRPTHAEAVLAFLFVYVAAAASKKCVNPNEHSFYNGRPRLQGILAKLGINVSEVTCKRFFEPFAAGLLGTLVMPLDAGLGSFFCLGGLSMGMLSEAHHWHSAEIAKDLRDAEIEQEMVFGTGADTPGVDGPAQLRMPRRSFSQEPHPSLRIHARLDPKLLEMIGVRKENDDGEERIQAGGGADSPPEA